MFELPNDASRKRHTEHWPNVMEDYSIHKTRSKRYTKALIKVEAIPFVYFPFLVE